MEITFAELGLNEQILAGVATLGFNAPTPVQAAAIPAVLAGKDVVASAQTGTGKTAAFMLPTLQRIAVEKPGGAEKPDAKEPNATPIPARSSSPQHESLRPKLTMLLKAFVHLLVSKLSLSPAALATSTR